MANVVFVCLDDIGTLSSSQPTNDNNRTLGCVNHALVDLDTLVGKTTNTMTIAEFDQIATASTLYLAVCFMFTMLRKKLLK